MPIKAVLVPVPDGFEEIETFTPVDILRRAGAKVVTAALGNEVLVTGRSGITLQADKRFDDCNASDFDMLLIPGGPGVNELRAEQRLGTIVRYFAAASRLMGAICAAPLVLHDSGVLIRRRYTAHFCTQSELPDALYDEPVVRDGNIITARGAGVAVAFSIELIRALYDDAKADEVAQSIMV